jgi:rhamnogalacturonyl hydrolase YesR
VLGILSAYSRPVSVIAEDMPSKDSVKAIMKRVADWQIEHMDDTSHTTRVGKPPHHIRHWTHGALWVGMVKWANMADDDVYWAFLTDMANRGNWELHDRIYHADDHTVGQLYVELYRKFGGDAKFVPTMQRLDYIMQHPSKEPMWHGQREHLERWTWCDALFMSPPVWAKMSTITGDPKYLDWMVNEYKATTNHLWDPEAHLFYRDNNFIDRRDEGRKIFWARGNGWVFSGLTLILDELEPESAYWAYFVGIYRQMATKLLEIQTSDGYWAMSLLAADLYPTQETSGTSFFTFGLAWGINHGILDRDTFLPAVLKGWQSVTTAVTDDGMLGYVQPIGAKPGSAWPDKTEVYGVGAFLAAGSEVYQLAK